MVSCGVLSKVGVQGCIRAPLNALNADIRCVEAKVLIESHGCHPAIKHGYAFLVGPYADTLDDVLFGHLDRCPDRKCLGLINAHTVSIPLKPEAVRRLYRYRARRFWNTFQDRKVIPFPDGCLKQSLLGLERLDSDRCCQDIGSPTLVGAEPNGSLVCDLKCVGGFEFNGDLIAFVEALCITDYRECLG